MKCPKCGYVENDESEFCSRCGKLLKVTAEGEAVEEEDEEAIAAKQQKKRRTVLMGAGGVVVAALIVFGLTQVIHGAPAQVTGAWSDSSFGGFLALLTSGSDQLNIQAEAPNGALTGTLAATASQTITKGTVRGRKVSVSTLKDGAYKYYTFTGSVSKDGKTIKGVVTTYTQGDNNQYTTAKKAETFNKV